MAFGAYIPALADGTAAADGSALAHLAGYQQNQSASNHLQTDATVLATMGSPFVVGGVFQRVDFDTDWATHLNGTEGVWIQWEKTGSGSACHIKEIYALPKTQLYTPAEYIKMVKWAQKYTSVCGAGLLVPAEVTPGTGIGPDLDWADNGDGKILLVEDA